MSEKQQVRDDVLLLAYIDIIGKGTPVGEGVCFRAWFLRLALPTLPSDSCKRARKLRNSLCSDSPRFRTQEPSKIGALSKPQHKRAENIALPLAG